MRVGTGLFGKPACYLFHFLGRPENKAAQFGDVELHKVPAFGVSASFGGARGPLLFSFSSMKMHMSISHIEAIFSV